jgi:hypothetical protein
MKTTLRYLRLNAQATWHHQVEKQLKSLHSLTAINGGTSSTPVDGDSQRSGLGEVTKERANQQIADHLLAFARHFSADTKPV